MVDPTARNASAGSVERGYMEGSLTKRIALILLAGLLGLLIITVVFSALRRPIELNTAEIKSRTTEAARVAASEREARLAEQLKWVKPFVEYQGNTLVEGERIIGELTYYCACAQCNGADNARITADGTVLDEYTEPLAGCNWLPLGSIVEVNGQQYRIADRGGHGLDAVGRLDVYEPGGHQAALDGGRVCDVEITIVYLPQSK
jgi:hypothetical protein